MEQVTDYKIDHKLNIPVKAGSLVESIHYFDLDLKSNHIYLMNNENYLSGIGTPSEEPGVEFSVASNFIKNMNLCMRVNPQKDIVIHMSICGGFWEQGMAIYDLIKSCPTCVTVLNYTHARSMSSIIFSAANKAVMMPNSHFMFHEGSMEVSGTNKAAKSLLKFTRQWDDKMLEIYAYNLARKGFFAGRTEKTIKNWLQSTMDKQEDVWLNAKEAVRLGFADEVFDYNWGNLTIYNNEQKER
ncbi:MAG: ATP-dependent Clp protease proteolytic subunit [Planctomycetota bacterium]|nr:ATP-dependent Clp protease proteolytic subunit [Planctomycetota bacterium]MDE2217250.1 ATP-dependent Clp protease proteolytic subunit [Planctomycetota bacterium]